MEENHHLSACVFFTLTRQLHNVDFTVVNFFNDLIIPEFAVKYE